MVKALSISLALVLTLGAAHPLFSQCDLPQPPGTGTQGCQNAPLFCSDADLDGFCSTTGITGAGGCPSQFCGTCENSHWLSFTAGSSTLVLTITPSNCLGQPSGSGLQAQLFATYDCNSFIPVSNCANPGQDIPLVLTGTNLIIGEVLYLLIDGYAADICDYSIELTQGTVETFPNIPGNISGPASVCPGASANFSVQAGTGVTFYDWTLTPPIGTIANDGNNTITVNFSGPGNAQLCVTPSNACEAGPPVCKIITSTPIPPLIETISFCFGETWTCQGQTYTSPGSHAIVYDSWLGCDSTRICIGIGLPPNPIPAAVYATICQGETYQQGGNEYSASGQYTDTLTAENGCDSIQTLILIVLEAEAVIAPPGTLACGGPPTLVLDGTGSTILPSAPGAVITYEWSGPGVVSGGNTLNPVVNQIGTYCLNVTQSYQGIECSDVACVVVPGEYPPLQPAMTGPSSACNGTTMEYIATPSASGPSPTGYSWSVTGGTFTQSADTIFVTWTSSGQGEICVTADNDCGSSQPVCLPVGVSENPITMPPVEAVICQGETYPFAGNNYDQAGQYEATLESYLGCDSVVTLILYVLHADAVIEPPGMLECNGVLLLNASGSTSIPDAPGAVISYSWMGPSIVSGGNTLTPTINSPGVYSLIVKQWFQGVECQAAASVTVLANVEAPGQPVVQGPLDGCLGMAAEYYATPSGSGPPPDNFSWTVNGTYAGTGDTINVTWTTPGPTQVCATALNPCGSSEQTCFTVLVQDMPIILGGITGPAFVCPGATVAYSVPPSPGILIFHWVILPSIGQVNNNGNHSVSVEFSAPGTAQLCVTPLGFCGAGPIICKTIISTPIPPQTEAVTFCLGDTWTCQGQTFSQPGTQTFVYGSWLGCDSTRICIGIALPPIVMPPVQAVICQGETYPFAGNTFEETGVYTVALPSSQGCDSVVTLALTALHADAVIALPGVLNCTSPTLVLDGAGSTLIPDAPGAVLNYLWIGPGLVSGENTLTPTISLPGIYTLFVTQTYLGVTCLGQASVMVTADNAVPEQPSIAGPSNVCTGTVSTFEASPSGSGPTPDGFTWTVTGGAFIANGNTVTVTWAGPGQGMICVTADNDCGASQADCIQVEVLETPVAQFGYVQNGAEVSFTDASTAATGWIWDFGDGNTSTGQNPVHTYAVDGEYVATLTATRGICEDTVSQTIEITTGALEIPGLSVFSLKPSIGPGQFMLTIDLASAADFEVSVVNAFGQTVHRLERTQTAHVQEEVNITGMAPGIYFVQLSLAREKALRRYVLLR